MTLFQQEGKVVGPDAGHFVEEDQGTLEAIVDLFIFCPIPSWIEGRNVFDSEIEILFKEMTRQRTTKFFFLKKRKGVAHHLPKFVGPRQSFAGSLENEDLFLNRPRLDLVLDVPQPWLQRGIRVS